MPEINYKEFNNYLKKKTQTADGEPMPSVCLIHGEEVLYKRAHHDLVDALLPTPADKHNHDIIDGENENVSDVLNRMNTYSLLAGTKIVSFQDARLFYVRQNKDKLLENAKSAWQNRAMKKAAGYVLNAMVSIGITFDDLDRNGKGLFLLLNDVSDADWLEAIVLYCTENQLELPVKKDYLFQLQQAIEKGFPTANHLIITTDLVDRRRGLYTCLKQYGLIVDCSIPKGNRQADKKAQMEVMRDRVVSILSPLKKKLEPRAFSSLLEMTGFDLRTFSGNLEKLVLFAGSRETITDADVRAVLDRTREDPIYEFTGAVSDRALEKALGFLQALLAQNMHPLQILSALINHFRKVLLAKAFMKSGHGRSWRGAMPFSRFKTEVLPAIKAYDAELIEMNERWDSMMMAAEQEPAVGTPVVQKKKPTKKKKSPVASLMVAPTPNNPYPVYLMMKKADNYTMDELVSVYTQLSQIDIQLKSTPLDPRILLERLILQICAKSK